MIEFARPLARKTLFGTGPVEAGGTGVGAKTEFWGLPVDAPCAALEGPSGRLQPRGRGRLPAGAVRGTVRAA